jgi:polyhydroxybutyrate depolymerase
LNAKNAKETLGFDALVERERFVAVYPNAVNGNWNDGRIWAGARRLPDDVAFLRALAGTLTRNGTIDPRRLYVTGPSNGGMMTFRLICEAADLFAGAAPIIANLPADLAGSCKPARPIPVLVMNGTADPLVPYRGGAVGFLGQRGRVLATDESVAFLRNVNGCAGDPFRRELPQLDRSEGSRVAMETWVNCSSGAPVALYRIEGGGHRVPRRNGPNRPLIDRLFGNENHDFDAAEAIWSFLRDKRK